MREGAKAGADPKPV